MGTVCSMLTHSCNNNRAIYWTGSSLSPILAQCHLIKWHKYLYNVQLYQEKGTAGEKIFNWLKSMGYGGCEGVGYPLPSISNVMNDQAITTVCLAVAACYINWSDSRDILWIYCTTLGVRPWRDNVISTSAALLRHGTLWVGHQLVMALNNSVKSSLRASSSAGDGRLHSRTNTCAQ